MYILIHLHNIPEEKEETIFCSSSAALNDFPA